MLRWLLAVLGLLVVVLLLVVALGLGTGWGRARLLALALGAVNASIPGKLRVARLELEAPFGCNLEDIALFDPSGQQVLGLHRLRVQVHPLQLLSRRIVLGLLELDTADIDARELTRADRGLPAALVDPHAPASPPSQAAPPQVRVDRIVLRSFQIQAPELPQVGALALRDLGAEARFELDGAARIRIDQLDAAVFRAGKPLAQIGPIDGRLDLGAGLSTLRVRLAAGAASLALEAEGELPTLPRYQHAPLRARLRLQGLRAEDLADWLQDATLADAFAGDVGLSLDATGSVDDVVIRGTLDTRAGQLQIQLGALREERFGVSLESERLLLHELRTDLPAPPIGLRLRANLDLSHADAVPLQLAADLLRFGDTPLPNLDVNAVLRGRRLSPLSARARLGNSSFTAQGEAGFDGTFDVQTELDLQTAELVTLDRAVAAGLHPHGRLQANLSLKRALDGAVHLFGTASAQQVRAARMALGRARVKVDLEGLPGAPQGKLDAQLEQLDTGAQKLGSLELAIKGGPLSYHVAIGAEHGRVSGDGGISELEQLHARFELAPSHGELRLSGAVHGAYAGRPFALRMAPTRLESSGAFATEGLEVTAAGQSAKVTGEWGRTDSTLVLEAEPVDLHALGELVGAPPGLSGRAALRARLAGSAAVPKGSLDLRWSSVGLGDATPLDGKLTAELDAKRGEALLDAALCTAPAPVRSGLANLHGSARFKGGPGWLAALENAEGRLRVSSRELDLALVESWLGKELPVIGKLSARIELDGSARAPGLGAELKARVTPRATGHLVELQQTLDYHAGQLQTRVTLDDARGAWLKLEGELSTPGDRAPTLAELRRLGPRLLERSGWRLGMNLTPRPASQLPLRDWTPDPDFELAGTLAVRHEPGAEPEGHAQLLIGSMALPAALQRCEADPLELRLDADLERGRLKVLLIGSHRSGELLRSTADLRLGLAAALGGGTPEIGALSAELRAQHLRLQSLPFLCQQIRGELDARMTLTDPLGATPGLHATASVRGFTLGAEPALGLALDAEADHEHARLKLDLSAPEGRSELAAALPVVWSRGHFTVAPDAKLSGNVHLAQLPIAPLIDPSGPLSQARGRLSGDVRVQGSLDHPEPEGHLEVVDGEFTATALAQPLQGIQGRIEFGNRRLSLSQFQVRDGKGEVRVDGEAQLSEPSGLEAALKIVAKNFPLRQQGRVVATTSAHATVDAKLAATRSDVKVLLQDADTWLENDKVRAGLSLDPHPDFVMSGKAAAGSSKRLEPGNDADSARATFLELDASDHFWVKREDFAIQLATKLKIEIDGAKTNVTGRVDINRGYLDLLGRVFDIEPDSYLTFTGSRTIDPLISITANYEQRSSSKVVSVKITGRGSHPELAFSIAGKDASAGDALRELIGARQSSGGGDAQAKNDATAFVSGVTAGLLATSARRELGAAAPILMIEPGDQGGGRIRAGFELDSLLPGFLRRAITGVYVEGIVAEESGQGQPSSTQAGVLVELYFPHQLFSTGQWGPGTTWSLDWGWQVH